MLLIGSHVSFRDKQLLGSVEEAISYGSNTFMIYTGAPQNSRRRSIDDNLTLQAYNLIKENDVRLDKVVCHAPYIINLANDINPAKYEFSISFLKNEIDRTMALGIKYLIIHPGSAVKVPRDKAIKNIINGLNQALNKEDNITILLETMSGKGTELGINLSELKTIYDGVILKEKIGVCIDTCHLNDSGVDINFFDKYLDEFDEVLGIDKIKCVHVNDSKNELGVSKDRHENLGFGTIGFDALLSVIYNERLKDVPKILETPYLEDIPPYKHEIEMIKNKTFNDNLKEDIKYSGL